MITGWNPKAKGRSPMRKAFAIVFAFCVAVGVTGFLIAAVGEWNARRQLSPEMRSPEAIQYHFDGTVCFACEMWGFMLMVAAFIMGGVVGLTWVLSELVYPDSADKLTDE